jgi:peptidoglycan hydrolase-like protein with peptidoglycan-binding domain
MRLLSIRKYVAGALVVVSLMPISSMASTTPQPSIEQLTAQIAELVKIVTALQQQLVAVRGGVPSIPSVSTLESGSLSCASISSNMWLGVSDRETGGDVSRLQKFLHAGGDYTREVTGFYGPATAEAVQRYQSRTGIVTGGDADTTGYGIVGSKTRMKMNSACSNAVAVVPVGETRQPFIPPIPNNDTSYQALPVDSSISGTVALVSANEDKAFKWGTNGRIHAPDWKWQVSLVNSGSQTKTVKRMVLVHNTSGEGWATDATAKNPLRKSLFILGTTLSDTCGSSCEVFNIQSDNLSRQIPASGTYSFFAYGYPWSRQFTGGKLIVEFTDGTGANLLIPPSSITPSSDTPSAGVPSITVTVPGSDSVLKSGGDSVTVRWSTQNISSSAYLDLIRLVNVDLQREYNLVSYVLNDGSETVTIPTVPAGTYTMQIKSYVKGYEQAVIGSSNKFSIIAPTTDAPIVTVLAPNGGESYQSSGSVAVSWSQNNAVGPVKVRLSNTVTGIEYYVSGDQGGGTGKNMITLSGEALNVPAGQYRITICDDGSVNPQAPFKPFCDSSNAPFTITAPQTIGSCTDSDGGRNPDVAGLTDGRVNGLGTYFNDVSVASNGGVCSGDTCTSVAEGYCTAEGTVTNILTSCPSGYSVNGACAPRPVVNQVSLSVSLIDASSDKVSTTFSPGFGVRLQDPNANDWHWRATLSGVASQKTITGISIVDENSGQAWSTSDNRYYPMVVYRSGVPMVVYRSVVPANSQYGQTFNIPEGTTVLDLYGQPEAVLFPGGVATVTFSDGTSVSMTMSSSDIRQAVATAPISGAIMTVEQKIAGILESLADIARSLQASVAASAQQ